VDLCFLCTNDVYDHSAWSVRRDGLREYPWRQHCVRTCKAEDNNRGQHAGDISLFRYAFRYAEEYLNQGGMKDIYIMYSAVRPWVERISCRYKGMYTGAQCCGGILCRMRCRIGISQSGFSTTAVYDTKLHKLILVDQRKGYFIVLS